MSALLLGAALAATPAGSAAAADPQRELRVPQELLDRVAGWAEQFLAGFPDYAAVETLVQTRWDRSRRENERRIVSDYLVLRLGEESRELAEFRDVVAVDGKALQSPEERAAKRQRLAAARTRAEITALVEDPRRHRLAPEMFANLGLLVSRLARRNHDKLRFYFPADVADAVLPEVLIAYRQNDGRGLIEVGGRPVYPRGSAWVGPDDGHVARMEEEFERGDTRYSVAVDFTAVAHMDTWLPEKITVRIFQRGRLTLQEVYSYANFRPLASRE